jgi:hypothetical protein
MKLTHAVLYVRSGYQIPPSCRGGKFIFHLEFHCARRLEEMPGPGWRGATRGAYLMTARRREECCSKCNNVQGVKHVKPEVVRRVCTDTLFRTQKWTKSRNFRLLPFL